MAAGGGAYARASVKHYWNSVAAAVLGAWCVVASPVLAQSTPASVAPPVELWYGLKKVQALEKVQVPAAADRLERDAGLHAAAIAELDRSPAWPAGRHGSARAVSATGRKQSDNRCNDRRSACPTAGAGRRGNDFAHPARRAPCFGKRAGDRYARGSDTGRSRNAARHHRRANRAVRRSAAEPGTGAVHERLEQCGQFAVRRHPGSDNRPPRRAGPVRAGAGVCHGPPAARCALRRHRFKNLPSHRGDPPAGLGKPVATPVASFAPPAASIPPRRAGRRWRITSRANRTSSWGRRSRKKSSVWRPRPPRKKRRCSSTFAIRTLRLRGRDACTADRRRCPGRTGTRSSRGPSRRDVQLCEIRLWRAGAERPEFAGETGNTWSLTPRLADLLKQ